MGIREKIENDFKEALKKRDKVVISTLRMLKSALYNKEIEKRGEKLQDAEVVKVLTREVQQHKDSIEQFKKGNRPELAKKEARELEVLKKYLPRQLSAQEVTAIIEKVIAETGAKEKSDFGKVMKSVMAELKGSSQGRMVSQIVSAKLCLDKKKP